MNHQLADYYWKYDPNSGEVYWKVARGGSVKKGQRAGSLTGHGYIGIHLNGKVNYAHRIAWLLTHGNLPYQIDHINHDRSDNRLVNLRAVGKQDNNRNITLQKNNKSGVMGVCWHKRQGRWIASIWKNSERIHLGYFSDWFEAVCARKSAENNFGYHSNHGNI